jgi:hypothetical protein
MTISLFENFRKYFRANRKTGKTDSVIEGKIDDF